MSEFPDTSNLKPRPVDLAFPDRIPKIKAHICAICGEHVTLTPKIKIVRTVISMIIGFIIGMEIGKGHLNFAIIALVGGIACYKLFKRMKRESLISCGEKQGGSFNFN